MALKAFQREGLRRDKNLVDLPSPNSALNNILATPTMIGTNESFTIADLAPIQNIYITNITSSTFTTLDGVTLEFTVILPGPPATIDNTSNPLPFKPLVKIKNRLDTAYFSTGEPFFYGGDGPDASYYDSPNIIRNPPSLVFDTEYEGIEIIKSGNNLYRTTNGALRTTAQGNLTHLGSAGLVDGFSWVAYYKEYEPYLFPVINELTYEDENIRDNFWERGQFVYGSKVQASFVSLFGGANWQGMFKSVEPGYARFYLRTTGSTVFKFQHPLYPSYSQFKYGKVDMTWEQNNGTFSAGGTYLTTLQTILSDPTRKWIKVICDQNVQLQTEDIIYLEIEEGPLVARQYQIYGLTAKDLDAQPQDPTLVSGQTIFFVEATTDFNLNNVDYTAIPTVNDPAQDNGYNGIARYFPWERRPYKTYFNSTKHKISISPSDFTITGANNIQFADENLYRSIFIEDYIYDYRRRSTDVIADPDPLAPAGSTIPVYPVRRYKVVSCNDGNLSIGVELDSNYFAVTETENNDQYGYVDSLSGQLKFTPSTIPATEEAERIENVFNSGNINDTIDTGTGTFSDPLFSNTPTETLYYVARIGDSVARYRYWTIDQFLERGVDYAIDWTYFTKDEDISPTSSEKAWVLWYRSETNSDYGPLNYKHLYAKDYKFYEIGDFKRFLDNSVLLGGTSREDGIEQRAFGKPKLVNKGDQYNMMYSLLPIKSEYDPPVNFNEVVKSMTGSIADGSRAISVSDLAGVSEGNYILDNSSVDATINGSNAFGYRGRVIEKLFGTNIVITSQLSTAAADNQLYIVDHKGFITSLKITGGSGNSYSFEGDGSEIKIGHVIVTPSESGRTTYVRIVKVDYDSNAQTGTFVLDTSINTPTLVLVYYDRGIDITKPLAAFCTDSGCGQHAYSGETTDTQYIAIRATFNSGADGQLDSYLSNNQGNVQTINNNSGQIQWLLENNMGDVDENNYNNNIFNLGTVKAQWDSGLGARGSTTEEGATSISTSTQLPIGWIKGLVRLKGKIWDGTDAGNEYEYYYIVRLGNSWQSNVDTKLVPETVAGAGDSNGLSRNVGYSPRAVAGSLWNVQSYTLQINGGPANYTKAGDIANQTNLNTANSSGSNGFWRVTTAFDISTAQQTYFENLLSFTPNSPGTTYRLEVGNYIRKIGSTLWWFNDFNDFQDVYTVWGNIGGSNNPSGSGNTGISNGSGRTQQLIYLQEQQGPVKVTGSSLSDNFKYVHYRRKQYEIVPINQNVENATASFGHLRLINVNANTSSLVDNILQNGTNKLSVFTFANTTDNRELCCPPLDTSPPFDSSPIGLSTTALEPDMSIDGLVNVRSINGTHPDEKIHPITLTSTPFNSTTINNAGVNKKFQVMFNGVKYDMLLADSNPVVP